MKLFKIFFTLIFLTVLLSSCSKKEKISVLQEQDFMDALYPWLEPRTAPKALPRMRRLMQEPLIEQSIQDRRVRYFVWLDGATKTVDKAAHR